MKQKHSDAERLVRRFDLFYIFLYKACPKGLKAKVTEHAVVEEANAEHARQDAVLGDVLKVVDERFLTMVSVEKWLTRVLSWVWSSGMRHSRRIKETVQREIYRRCN